MVAPSRAGQPPVAFEIGDFLRLRKAHACGGDLWVVRRLGADIGLTCQTCGRHVLLERRVLEGRLASIDPRPGSGDGNRVDAAPAPGRTSD